MSDHLPLSGADPLGEPDPNRMQKQRAPLNGGNSDITDAEVVKKSANQNSPPPPAPFKPIGSLPSEQSDWQCNNLIRKKGVALLVAPPGVCSFALCAYFSALLSGKAHDAFGYARYPGDVLVSTYTSEVEGAVRKLLPSFVPSKWNVSTQLSRRRFNWRTPMVNLNDAIEQDNSDGVAAIIVDAGPFPSDVNEAVVESAHVTLSQLAENADCLILLVVEATGRSKDPFERVPRNLRMFRGTLLAVPMVSKHWTVSANSPPQFFLIRLADTSASALGVKFMLQPMAGSPDQMLITWDRAGFGDPRTIFLAAETDDMTMAQRFAVDFAVQTIRSRGATASAELIGAGLSCGIARTTMRDALSAGCFAGVLLKFRCPDGRWLWALPRPPGSWV